MLSALNKDEIKSKLKSKPIKSTVIGDVGWWIADYAEPRLMMRTFSGLVQLNHPMNTWDASALPSLTGDLYVLPKGARITLELQ